jgi:hypothetical protein
MQSLKTVCFMAPKSFGVDLNLREWQVGEKKLPIGDGFAIAWWLLLQTRATTKEWQHVPTLLQEFQI